MKLEELGPDAIAPADRAALATERAWVEGCPSSLPFLLLPVRLETRFMQREEPIALDTAVTATKVRETLTETLRVLKGLEEPATTLHVQPRVTLGKRAKVEEKRREREEFDRTNAAIAALRGCTRSLERSVDDVLNASPAEIDEIAVLCSKTTGALDAALAGLGRIRSPYQRARFERRLTELRERRLERAVARIEQGTLRSLRVLSRARTVEASDLGRRILELSKQTAARKAKGFDEPPSEGLFSRLSGLEAASATLVRGSASEIAEIRARFRSLREDLALWQSKLADDKKTEPTALRLATALGKLERLERATPMSRPRLLDGSQAADELASLLKELAHALDAPVPPRSRRDAFWVSQAETAVRIAREISARAERVSLVPAAKKAFLSTLSDVVEARGQGLLKELDAFVERGGPRARAAKVLAGAARQAFTTMPRVARQLSSDAPEDAANRELVFTEAVPTRTVHELWVRIYPDDIAVNTHELAFTDEEINGGSKFWVETTVPGATEVQKRAAWRALCQRYGTNRAAFIARTFEKLARVAATPTNDEVERFSAALRALELRIEEASTWYHRVGAADSLLRALNAAIRAGLRVGSIGGDASEIAALRLLNTQERLEKLTGRALGDARTGKRARPRYLEVQRRTRFLPNLVRRLRRRRVNDIPNLPDVSSLPRKAASWTVAPHSRVLPDRFVVVTVKGNLVTHVVPGATIAATVTLGLDPDPAHAESARFELDAAGDLSVPAPIRWMTHYPTAVSEGMAITVPLTDEEAQTGFDRVYVIGARHASADDARKLVENLLDDHHYSPAGLGIVPVGTATNNSERERSGYRGQRDPDDVFSVERGAPLFDAAVMDELQKSDGLRLAQALGIDPGRLAHVENAERKDVSEGLLFNRALYRATLGDYLEEYLGNVLSLDVQRFLRGFFLENVSARGLLPAFRAGAQPYGLLTTTAFSRFVPSTGDALPLPHDPSLQVRVARYNRLLRDVLAVARDDFDRIGALHVKHAHSENVADPQQHFLDMLGLHPGSVGNDYRLALNCARRHPVASAGGELSFGIPPKDSDSGEEAVDHGPFGLLRRFEPVFKAALLGEDPLYGAAELAAPLVDDKGKIAAPFVRLWKKLLNLRAYEVRLLEQPKPLVGTLVDPEASEWITALLAATPAELSTFGRPSAGVPRSLLFLLLRQALALEYREAALSILMQEDVLIEKVRRQAGASNFFLVSTLVSESAVTRWNYLFSRLWSLDGLFGRPFPATSSLYPYLNAQAATMAEYLAARGDNDLRRNYNKNGEHAGQLAFLAEHAAAVGRLATLPETRLGELLSEHLDLVSYRMDAWSLGLANQRLREQRSIGTSKTGLFVGAYSWVEKLSPGGTRELAQNVPASLGSASKPIYHDPDIDGFVHGPSVNHAVAAAILRSGYLSEVGRPDIENRMSVNLSSRRVRLALELIEGVRAGNDLGSLLGYRFERFLHEAYASEGVTLDDLIYRFRHAYPSSVPVDSSLGTEGQARRAVVDGLALLDGVNDWLRADTGALAGAGTLFDTLFDGGAFGGYPWGIIGQSGERILPDIEAGTAEEAELETKRLIGVLRALDSIADALDAVGDLVLAESSYQIVRGNHARAAAVLSALGEGRLIPQPEVVNTPRTGTVVSQRLLLQLEPRASTYVAPAWAAVDPTPRSIAEPTLNAWLAELLGAPGAIAARVLAPDDSVSVVTVDELGLQPIDLLAILGEGLEGAQSELAARIGSAAGATASARILFERAADWDIDTKSFLEIASLLGPAHELLAKARTANASDYALAETTGAGESGEDTAELETRVRAAYASVVSIGTTLISLLGGGDEGDAPLFDDAASFLERYAGEHRKTENGKIVFRDVTDYLAVEDAIVEALLAAANLGIREAVPPLRSGTDETRAFELLERLETAFAAVAGRVRETNLALDALGAAPSTKAVIDAARKALGEGFVVLSRFTLRNGAELTSALAQDLTVAPAVAVDGWLSGVAAVRERSRYLSQIFVLGEAFGARAPGGRPLQLPYEDDQFWVGIDFPAELDAAGNQRTRVPSGDKLSIVVFGPEHLTPATAGAKYVALLVDQWTEVVPHDEETTGIALNYDQPDAAAPQCLLLAVAPRLDRSWRFDDLVHTLHDTFELAKNRAVEPEHLGDEIYGQLLPAVTGEVVPEFADPTAEEDPRVVLDFGVNNLTAAGG